MKKIKYVLIMCLLMIMSTGCVKFNANMDINKDKSMKFEIIYALDKTVFGEEGMLKEADFEEVKKEGFTVTKYSEGNYEGFTLTKKINNIDEVSSEVDAEYDLSGMMNSKGSENNYLFKVVKGKEKNTYTAKFKFNANDSGLNTEEDDSLADESDLFTTDETEDMTSLDDFDFSGMMSSMDLSFNVTLPYGAISNNATKVSDDNKKLSWTLSSTDQEYIEFVFELNNNEKSNMTMIYIIIAAVVLVVVAVLAFLLSRKKHDKMSTVNPKEEPKVDNTNNEIK